MTDEPNSLNKIKELADKIYKNPMFQLMLGGNELFHSNFIAWLIESKNIKPYDLFKGALSEDHNIDGQWFVQREKHNLDILITDQLDEDKVTKVIIIENKFKAFPDNEQLLKYRALFTAEKKPLYEGKKQSFILLSLLQPDELFQSNEKNRVWHALSYEKLLGNLQELSIVGDHAQYLSDYCQMLQRLLKLFDLVEKHEEKRVAWFDTEKKYKKLDDVLKEKRLIDFLSKRRAGSYASKIRNYLRNITDVKFKLVVGTGFTRKNPLINVYLEFEASDITWALGIQVQENQYRRALWNLHQSSTPDDMRAAIDKDGDKAKKSENIDRYLGKVWPGLKMKWFAADERPELPGGYFGHLQKQRAKRQHFYSFSPNFIYQYYKISDKENELNPSEIMKAVECDIKYAAEIIESFKTKPSSPAAASN